MHKSARRALTATEMQHFDVLFDHGEPSTIEHPAYAPYGQLSFPQPHSDRPWVYSNFVQSLDGVASLKGKYASGSHISCSREDRWLMDLLRAHADALLLGINTLVEETQLARETHGASARGPVYAIEDELCLELRERLGVGREMNIFVTGACGMQLRDFRVFDGDRVDSAIITTKAGAQRLAQLRSHPHVKVVVAGEKEFVDLPQAMKILRTELGIKRLLCEGGPTLYGYMARSGLIDEKFLTISPVKVGIIIPPEQEPSAAERANPPKLRPTIFGAPGFTKDEATWWRWLSCRRVGDHQFNRYRKKVSRF